MYGNEETYSVFDPFVYEEDDKFIMVVSERKNHSLVRIESCNGIDWKTPTTLLERIPNTWEHLGKGIVDNNVLSLYCISN